MQMELHDTTYQPVSDYHSTIVVIRHRQSQTLYISPILPFDATNPGLPSLLTAVICLSHDDVMAREACGLSARTLGQSAGDRDSNPNQPQADPGGRAGRNSERSFARALGHAPATRGMLGRSTASSPFGSISRTVRLGQPDLDARSCGRVSNLVSTLFGLYLA